MITDAFLLFIVLILKTISAILPSGQRIHDLIGGTFLFDDLIAWAHLWNTYFPVSELLMGGIVLLGLRMLLFIYNFGASIMSIIRGGGSSSL